MCPQCLCQTFTLLLEGKVRGWAALADAERFCHSWVANFGSPAIQLNILNLKITLDIIESESLAPSGASRPLFDHYEEDPSSRWWGWIVSTI